MPNPDQKSTSTGYPIFTKNLGFYSDCEANFWTISKTLFLNGFWHDFNMHWNAEWLEKIFFVFKYSKNIHCFWENLLWLKL